MSFDTEDAEKILNGSKIIRIYEPDDYRFEGGLTIVFEKDSSKGIYIMGYTELGSWVEFFQFGDFKYNHNEWNDKEIKLTLKENNLDLIK